MKTIRQKENNGFSTKKPKKNLLATIGIVAALAFLILLVFLGLRSALETETYYVLNTNVSARTRIEPEMLKEVVVSKDGAPQNAISLSQVEANPIYSKIPLEVGDILTLSNTGLELDTSTGIPDDWVVTSINISADKAAGGQVARGDYFDIIGITDTGAKYIAVNVLALDVNYSESQSSGADGEVTFNEELQYLIGAPAPAAASILDALDGDVFKTIRVVLSPRSILYKERNLDNLNGLVFKSTVDKDIIDLFDGTDRTFTTVLRDNNGRPVNPEYCKSGEIEPKELCKELEEMEDKEKNAQNSSSYNEEHSDIEGENAEEAERKRPVKTENTEDEEKTENEEKKDDDVITSEDDNKNEADN